MLNIIKATFYDKPCAWTDEQWQWDYGQILQFEGLELPEAYEVHFSNIAIGGESITQIGNAGGVTIPDQFFTTGETIYAWVYLHQGEDDGETVYSVTIPVKKRPQPSDTPPTPQEQSAINQAIAALNVAVEKSETAITHYPHIQDGTWWIWDVTTKRWVDTQVEAQGEPGEDGFSPEITVQNITGGHRITITDATSTKTVDVMDGEEGQPGATGNGIQSITKTGTAGLVDTYTITYTNGQTTTFTVTNGSDATVTVDDELSPTSTNPVQNKVITNKINSLDAGDIAYDDEETYSEGTVGDGLGSLKAEINNKIDKPQTAGTSGQVLTSDGQGGQSWQTPSGGDVTDVQVNGTSVVSQGVANVPITGSNQLGVVSVDNSYGITANSGRLQTYPATQTNIKQGIHTARPIVPNIQDASTFYGLAKVAGADMSQSSNPVGTYTDAAKIAIQKMLGIYEAPWELIREDVITNTTEADIEIAVDGNGQAFELTDLYLEVWIDALENIPANIGSYGTVKTYYGTTSLSNYFGVTTVAVGGATKSALLLIMNINGAIIRENTNYVPAGNSNTSLYAQARATNNRSLFSIGDFIFDKLLISAVTGKFSYRLYGKRKWS